MMKEKTELNSEVLGFQENKKRIDDRLEEANIRVMEKLSNFFTFVATLSSGAIVISVTFLGYFSKLQFSYVTLSKFVFSNALFLYTGWGLLLTSLLSAIYRNYYHIHYMHWEVTVEWLETMKKEKEYTVQLAGQNMISNIKDLDLSITRGSIDKMKDVIKENKDNSEKSIRNVRIFENIAQIGFGLGLLFLIIFAISFLGY